MIHQSPIAGSWYEGTRTKLTDQLTDLFENDEFGPNSLPEPRGQSSGTINGIIVPHAGYQYSGYTAAHSYKYLYEHQSKLDTAIIIGPNHRALGPEISISDAIAWETPLGQLGVDQDLIEFIQQYSFNQVAGKVEIEDHAHQQEHSIDIQLPFLQFLYDESLEIVPICLKNQNYQPVGIEIGNLVDDILTTFKDKNIAVIASTDLSHEYDYAKLEDNDEKIITAIASGDVEKFHQSRQSTGITMCGYGSVYSLLELNKSRNNQAEMKILSYTNSGKITGRKGGYTVGYLAAAITS